MLPAAGFRAQLISGQLEALPVVASKILIGLRVVERFRLENQSHFLARAPGDVTSVTYGRADVPRGDLLVERFTLARANGVEEVADVCLLRLASTRLTPRSGRRRRATGVGESNWLGRQACLSVDRGLTMRESRPWYRLVRWDDDVG